MNFNFKKAFFISNIDWLLGYIEIRWLKDSVGFEFVVYKTSGSILVMVISDQ